MQHVNMVDSEENEYTENERLAMDRIRESSSAEIKTE